MSTAHARSAAGWARSNRRRDGPLMPVYRTPNPQNHPTAGGPARPAGSGRPAPVLDIDVISHSLDQTRRIGARLAALLAPGDVILLEGPFGAGKTTLTQGIAR